MCVPLMFAFSNVVQKGEEKKKRLHTHTHTLTINKQKCLFTAFEPKRWIISATRSTAEATGFHVFFVLFFLPAYCLLCSKHTPGAARRRPASLWGWSSPWGWCPSPWGWSATSGWWWAATSKRWRCSTSGLTTMLLGCLNKNYANQTQEDPPLIS